MGRDYALEAAVKQSQWMVPWSWVPWGPPGGTFGEPMARICPICAALVPNEDGLLQAHLNTHGMPQGAG